MRALSPVSWVGVLLLLPWTAQAEIQSLNSEIDGLKTEGDVIAQKLEQRSKRFAGFMHSLHDLQLQLAEEAAASGTTAD